MEGERQRKTVLEVLREVNADVLGLQDVKAEEENGMKPLSDLARALGMNYVFAESWAPQCSIPATNFLQISPTLLKIQGGGAFGGYK